jgi:hypothetical protein
MGRVNQAQSEQREALLNRPTYQQVVEGFNKGGGTTSPSAPTILRVVSQGRMISISWDRQYNLTNLSHYVVQVSEDRENWYSLGTWAGDLNAVTTTYEQGIIHANIPHKDSGSVRTLYYRVAAVTYAEQQSDWSEIVSGSTKWLYVDVDYKTGGDYIYDSIGVILIGGIAEVAGPGDNTFFASGEIILSGGATYYEYAEEEYSMSGSMTLSGTADISVPSVFEFVSSSSNNTRSYQYGMDTISGGGYAAVLRKTTSSDDPATIQTYDTVDKSWKFSYFVDNNNADDVDSNDGLAVGFADADTVYIVYENRTSNYMEATSGEIAVNGQFTFNNSTTISAINVYDMYGNIVVGKAAAQVADVWVLDISGSNTTVSAATHIDINEIALGVLVENIDANKYAFMYRNNSGVFVKIGTWNGSSWSFGSRLQIHNSSISGFSMTSPAPNKLIAVHATSSNARVFEVMSISGTTVTHDYEYTDTAGDLGSVMVARDNIISRETATGEGEILIADQNADKVFKLNYDSSNISYDTSIDFLVSGSNTTGYCPIKWSDKSNGEFIVFHNNGSTNYYGIIEHGTV